MNHAPKEVTARFARIEHSVTYNMEGKSTVSVSLEYATETADGYLLESVVEITAHPQSDTRFKCGSNRVLT